MTKGLDGAHESRERFQPPHQAARTFKATEAARDYLTDLRNQRDNAIDRTEVLQDQVSKQVDLLTQRNDDLSDNLASLREQLVHAHARAKISTVYANLSVLAQTFLAMLAGLLFYLLSEGLGSSRPWIISIVGALCIVLLGVIVLLQLWAGGPGRQHPAKDE